ncbi:FRG domain-containing protein [Sphingopyxis sp. BSNA05]|uniref:FRG domain-containing protein n=1 Tax=Sphingopyxis sp. BSNA05 TaxID=1236614 RepID=UPI0015666F3D|nr:FRG domain-containing protein [Sphingopyxis sp. BSNA05]NRD90048.1 FRG domain-containing protein [Sphingopyxis sp. BSNA05]
MKFEDREVRSLSDLIEHLKDNLPSNRPTWFRGQRNADWDLEPGIKRHGGIDAERTLFKRFKQNAFSHVTSRPTTEWEWLFVMQHFGLPTRLLDWTESALIGLYFALDGDLADSPDSYAALWAIDPIGLNLTSKWTQDHEADIPGFDDDEDLEPYLPSKVGRTKMGLEPIAAIATRNNSRIQVQQGVFTIHHSNLEPLNDGNRLAHIWRYIIPTDVIAELRRDLEMLNLTRLSLFPDLANVANHARAQVIGGSK